MFRKFQKPKPVKKNCPFCKSARKGRDLASGGEDKEPDYRDFNGLRKYTSERGRILGRARTGICAKHQRRVDQHIKRARFLGYLPFVEGV
jgi:small subunit ribosomal protein S18